MASSIMNFTDNSTTMGKQKQNTASASSLTQDLESVVVYTCERIELPSSAANNVLIYARDTGEIFAGQGKGISLRNMSDVIVVKSFDYLPAVGVENKLYISKQDNAFAYYDGELNEYVYLILGQTSSSSITKTGIIEYDKANEFPLTGSSGSLYLTSDNKLYRWDNANNKYSLVSDQGSFESLLKTVNKLGDLQTILNAIGDLQKFKADRTELDAYRKKADKINLVDLDNDVMNAITMSGSNNSSSTIDEAAILSRLSALENSKADKSDLANYRNSSVPIGESDLSAAVVSKLNTKYDDTSIKNDIAALQSSKVDIVTANSSFRKVSDSIGLNDLSKDVIDEINKAATPYDDTAVKQTISQLQTDLANNYRNNATSIKESDLDSALASKINSLSSGSTSTTPAYDDTALVNRVTALEKDKADFTYSENTYVKKADINTYIDNAVNGIKSDISTINTAISGLSNDVSTIQYDVSTLSGNVSTLQSDVAQINSDISTIQTDLSAAQNNIADAKKDISALQTSVSNIQNDVNTNTADIAQIKTDLSNKADSSDLAAAKQDISTLQTDLVAAIKRIEALENASSNSSGGNSNNTENTNNSGTSTTTPTTPTDSSILYQATFDMTMMNGTVKLSDLDGYSDITPFTLNEFYGVDDNDTYDATLKKVYVKFLGYVSNGEITNAKDVIIPTEFDVEQEGYTASADLPCSYVSYDDSLGTLDFNGLGPSTMRFMIYKIA
jgi:predicted  nucleic acid-binding Zn-ribbon protein